MRIFATIHCSRATPATAVTPRMSLLTPPIASRCRRQADAASLAPLLCAGLIGWRSLKMAGDAHALGIYGFGAAAHIIAQVAKAQGRRIFAFRAAGR